MATVTAYSSPELPPFPVRKFTVGEYRQLALSGVLGEDDRVELLEGWIAPKMIHNPPHDAAIELVDEQLSARVRTPWRLRRQSAIETSDSCPEPDVAVVRGSIRDHATRHPEGNEIALVVEVADASLARDRLKAQIYARAGIPLYWIVNLRDRRLETFSDPATEETPPRYRQAVTFSQAESAPIAIHGNFVGPIAVGDLLP